MNESAGSRRAPRSGLHVSLKTKLSAGFLAVTLCCAAIAGALVDRNVRQSTLAAFEDRLSYETTMLGQMTATALFGEIDPSDTSLHDSVTALGAAVHTELSVIANDGTVVASSDAADPRALGKQTAAPEIATARATGSGTAVRDGRMYVARAISRDGQTLGFARSSVPMTEVTAYVLAVRKRMAYGSAIALVVAAVLGVAFSSKIVGPIRALAAGARRVGAGNFDHPIDVRTGDELEGLALSFNEMTRNLRRSIELLNGRNRDMRIVLDNVTQGLFTLDRACTVSKEKSAIVEKWFGAVAEDNHFVDAILLDDAAAAAGFRGNWEQLLEGIMPVDVILGQLPQRFMRGDRLFEMSFTPIFREGDADVPDKVLVVVTDATARVAAERAEAEQREVAGILERATRDKSGVLEFLLTADAQVRELTEATRLPLVEIKRVLHTLKGNAGIYGLHRIAARCHDIETRMQERDGDLLPDEMALLNETWSRVAGRLSALLGDASQVVIEDEDYSAVLRAILDGSPRTEVARIVLEWRMEKVSHRLERFAKQGRELAARMEKQVEIDVAPGALRLPREEWASFWAAFVHALRNAVDHGIEPEDERVEAGKTEVGRIRLSASRQDRRIVVEIEDDGRGIDWVAIAWRARRMDLPAATNEDLVAALFTDGLSSRDEATDVSGRGVGMGALQAACRELGGRIIVHTERGRGTTLRFEVPVRDASPTPHPTSDMKRISTVPARA